MWNSKAQGALKSSCSGLSGGLEQYEVKVMRWSGQAQSLQFTLTLNPKELFLSKETEQPGL